MRRPPSVLVVDDDASSRAILGLALRRAGFRPTTAAGGEEALELLRRRDFDWLVTDALMLPMNGFQLAARAREIRPGIRTVMISALDAAADARRLEIEKFFAKPVDSAALETWLWNGNGPPGAAPSA